MSMDLMKYVDQWFAVHLWRPGDQAKIEIQFWAPRSFPKDEMTAECDVHKMIFLPGLFMVLITTSCLSANLDKETKTFISFVIENVNKDASFFCNGLFFAILHGRLVITTVGILHTSDSVAISLVRKSPGPNLSSCLGKSLKYTTLFP